MSFAGRSVIVTGASRGIGAAIAIELGRRGANVVCAARASSANPLRLPGTVDETAQRINEAGGVGLAVPCDLTDDDDIERLIAVTIERFGRLDMLVNNAAVSFGGDLDIPLRRFEVLMRINVRAPLLATRLARPYLAARARRRPHPQRGLGDGHRVLPHHGHLRHVQGGPRAPHRHLRGGAGARRNRRQLLPDRRAGWPRRGTS